MLMLFFMLRDAAVMRDQSVVVSLGFTFAFVLFLRCFIAKVW